MIHPKHNAKRLTATIDVLIITGVSLFVGGLVLTMLGLSLGGRVTHFTLESTSNLIYLALLSSVAFCLWNMLLKYNKVGRVSVYNFLIPVFGALLSALFLGGNDLGTEKSDRITVRVSRHLFSQSCTFCA